MSFQSLFLAEEDTRNKEQLKRDLEELEFQLYRMQDNMKEIARKWQVIGIDQTKEDSWVIVYKEKDEDSCKIMLYECDAAFRGEWDFSIHAKFEDDDTIFIGDIKGPANKGYGSICMKHLKEVAKEHNIQYITGDIAERDWDHVDRLKYFYEKHNFEVDIDQHNKCGEIICRPFTEES